MLAELVQIGGTQEKSQQIVAQRLLSFQRKVSKGTEIEEIVKKAQGHGEMITTAKHDTLSQNGYGIVSNQRAQLYNIALQAHITTKAV